MKFLKECFYWFDFPNAWLFSVDRVATMNSFYTLVDDMNFGIEAA